MTIAFTSKGTANALIAGLKAMCSDDEAKDEAERLAQMFSEMVFSLTFDDENGGGREDRRANYLDGIVAVLEEFAVSKEDDGHGPNQEWPPGAPKHR